MYAVFTPALDAQTILRVVNAASLDTQLAPGSLATVIGTNLGTSNSTPVTFGGKAAAVVSASPTQLTVQIPFDAAPGNVAVQVAGSPSYNVTLTQYAPALFTANGQGFGNLDGLHSDGSLIDADNPAVTGETVTLYATGLGRWLPVNRRINRSEFVAPLELRVHNALKYQAGNRRSTRTKVPRNSVLIRALACQTGPYAPSRQKLEMKVWPCDIHSSIASRRLKSTATKERGILTSCPGAATAAATPSRWPRKGPAPIAPMLADT